MIGPNVPREWLFAYYDAAFKLLLSGTSWQKALCVAFSLLYAAQRMINVMSQRGHLAGVIQRLVTWRDEAVGRLRTATPIEKPALLAEKLSLDEALRGLSWIEKHGVDTSTAPLALPPLVHAYSDYRLMKDFESENLAHWRELMDEDGAGFGLNLSSDDLVVRRARKRHHRSGQPVPD